MLRGLATPFLLAAATIVASSMRSEKTFSIFRLVGSSVASSENMTQGAYSSDIRVEDQ